MNWYIAKVVFNILAPEAPSQFEEQLRLVEAHSLEEAFLKAKAIGINEEADGHLNTTRRVFVDVADIAELDNLQNGLELYSRIHRTKESREYIHRVHQRSLEIRLSSLQ